jgi:hypothetical protein
MGAIVFFAAAIVGCMLSGTLANKAMERWNSRLRAVAIGVIPAPTCVILGAFLSAQFYSEQELRTGVMFALGLMTIFAAGLTALVGGLIAAFIAIGLKQPLDTVWSSEDGDTEGYRSDDEKERYG